MAETRKIPVAGFMSPPGWLDPSPEEFRTILDGPAIIQQTMMPIYNFVFGKIANIAGTLPEMLYCARQLGSAESDVIAHTGTPFGWAGLGTEREARDRRDLMVDAAGGVPVVMAGLAILDGLRALGAEKLAISTPYYTKEWKEAWSAIVTSGGFTSKSPFYLLRGGRPLRAMIAAGYPADRIFYYRGGMQSWRVLGLTVTGEGN